jgi:hypothetical protein
VPTTSATFQDQSLLATIEAALARLTAERQRAEAEPGPFRDAASGPAPQKETAEVNSLGETIARLQQIKEWLESDERLLPVIDDYVGKHVGLQTRKLRRQNMVLTVGMTFAGAILGWLLSILLPASLLAVTVLR